MKVTGETEVLGGETCPSATLSTINPTWTDLRSNPGLRGWRSNPSYWQCFSINDQYIKIERNS
jgi:hypothetical protein